MPFFHQWTTATHNREEFQLITCQKKTHQGGGTTRPRGGAVSSAPAKVCARRQCTIVRDVLTNQLYVSKTVSRNTMSMFYNSGPKQIFRQIQLKHFSPFYNLLTYCNFYQLQLSFQLLTFAPHSYNGQSNPIGLTVFTLSIRFFQCVGRMYSFFFLSLCIIQNISTYMKVPVFLTKPFVG